MIKNITTSKTYYKTKFGGYIEKDVSTMNNDGTHKKAYICWYNMMKRCYCDKYHEKKPTYKDCFVCNEWLYFSNFEKWFNENYYELDDEKTELDKDILVKGNKEYSPKTAIFVPQRINKILLNKTKKSNCPIGVRVDTHNNNKYKVECTIYENGKSKKYHLGYFNRDNLKKAFQTYKNFKEKHIKNFILEYMNKIPQKQYKLLYDAIMNYEVEIND